MFKTLTEILAFIVALQNDQMFFIEFVTITMVTKLMWKTKKDKTSCTTNVYFKGNFGSCNFPESTHSNVSARHDYRF